MATQNMRPDAPSPFQSALLLTDEENNAFADRTALRNTGLRHFRVLTSGVETAQYLAQRVSTIIYPVTEVIVCLPHLSDMNQAEFAAVVRSHPLLPHMPLLAITAQRGNEALLHKAGYDAVLPRPYNTNTLIKVLHTVAIQSRQTRATLIETLKRNRAIPGHGQFDAMLARFIPPDKESMSGAECCQYGKELLLAQRYEKALPYLQKATTELASKAEACLALAMLWRDRRDYDKLKICLFGALKAFMDTDAWPQALTLSKKLVADYPLLPHPLLHELERRLRQRKTIEAVDMLPHIQSSLPHDDIVQTLLRGTQASPDPDEALAALLYALTQSAQPDILPLRDALLNAQPNAEPAKKSWYKRILSRDATAQASPSPATTAPADTSSETPAPSLAERRLLSIPADFSLVDDDVDSNIRKKGVKLDIDAPPPLILSTQENFAKAAPKRESLDKVELRDDEKSKSKNLTPSGFASGAPVLELLGGSDLLEYTEEDSRGDGKRVHGLRPSRLGDAWTMVRGTMRLYRSSK